jgi:hypothetical protein
MEFMGGGEVIWRKFSHMESNGFKVYTSNLTVDQSRRIIRDVVLGLEYRTVTALTSPFPALTPV